MYGYRTSDSIVMAPLKDLTSGNQYSPYSQPNKARKELCIGPAKSSNPVYVYAIM